MTQYHVLVLQRHDDGPLWRYMGAVEAANDVAARTRVLGQENIETATAVAVPDRSWNPEVFSIKVRATYMRSGVGRTGSSKPPAAPQENASSPIT